MRSSDVIRAPGATDVEETEVADRTPRTGSAVAVRTLAPHDKLRPWLGLVVGAPTGLAPRGRAAQRCARCERRLARRCPESRSGAVWNRGVTRLLPRCAAARASRARRAAPCSVVGRSGTSFGSTTTSISGCASRSHSVTTLVGDLLELAGTRTDHHCADRSAASVHSGKWSGESGTGISNSQAPMRPGRATARLCTCK